MRRKPLTISSSRTGQRTAHGSRSGTKSAKVTRITKAISVVFAILVICVAFVPERLTLRAQAPKTHRLEATPSTIAYGYYDAAATPVLRIASGDIIDVDTLLTNSPNGLQRAGVPVEQIRPR